MGYLTEGNGDREWLSGEIEPWIGIPLLVPRFIKIFYRKY